MECHCAVLWATVYGKPSGRIARLIFCATDGELFVLHGFVKKTQKTSPADLAIARKRIKEVEWMVKTKKNPHRGTLVDDWLKEEGIFEEVTQRAIKEVLAWQLAEAMKEKSITKTEMARRMKTSRFQLNRVLDPQNAGVSLDALNRAAAALGRKVRLELV